MQVNITKTGNITRSLKVDVSKDTLSELRKKVLGRINEKVNVAGFRRGKAPDQIIEKRYGNLIKEEILKEAVPFYYTEALKSQSLEAVGLPKIDNAEYKSGMLSFIAEVEIRPVVEIDPKVYKNIKMKSSSVDVESKEVGKFIGQFKESIGKALDKKSEEIDDNFVALWAGYKDEKELKQVMNSEVALSKVVQRRKGFEQQITENLLNKVKFQVPQSVVDEEQKTILSQQVQDLHRRGVSEEDIKKHYDDITEKSKSFAQDRVRLYYILEAIAKKENLKCDQNNIYEVVVGFILANAGR